MPERKKRMIQMVAAVLFICLAAYAAGVFFLKEDTDNLRAYYKKFQGVWGGEDSGYRLEVHRVTSAHIVASIWYTESNSESVLFSAVAEGEDRYRFALEKNPVNAGDSAFLKKYGVISIQPEGLRLEMSNAEGGEIKYSETYTKKEPLPEKKQVSLEYYMENNLDAPERCTAYRDSGGKVWTVSAVLEQPEEEREYNLYGIDRYCFASDCENLWGRSTESVSLGSGFQKEVYEQDDFVYTVIFDSYGLASEVFCMKVPEDSEREGDFLMQGDTVLRYLGYEEDKAEISLPGHTKKLASGAFTTYECAYQDKETESKTLVIPADVAIETDAFRHCGKLDIQLSEGRKQITEGAFAHLIPNHLFYTGSWVHIRLPHSLESLGQDALNQDEGTVCWMDYMRKIMTENSIADRSSAPVVVESFGQLKEIPEQSLRGVLLKGDFNRNSGLKVLDGDGLYSTKENGGTLTIPDDVKELKTGGVWLTDNDKQNIQKVYLPKGLEKIEDEAVVPVGEMPQLIADKESGYFFNNDLGWLFSKDKTELYSAVMDVTAFYIEGGGIMDMKPKYHKLLSADGYLQITIPEGVKNIHSYALSNMGYLGNWYGILLPKSLKKISRNAFYGAGYDLYFEGEVPEFYADFSEITLQELTESWESQPNQIFVKENRKQQFIDAFLAGQDVSDSQRTLIEDKIVEY